MDFAVELDALITKHRALGYDVGEMVADMEGSCAGLQNETDDHEPAQ